MFEPLAGFSCGESAGAAGDVVGWVEGVDVSSGVQKRFVCGVVQRTAYGDRGDVQAFRGEYRPGVQAVSAVVSGAREHADAQARFIPFLLVDHVEDGSCRRIGGHAHERHLIGEQRLFERAYGRGVECRCGQSVGVVCCLVFHGNCPYVLCAGRCRIGCARIGLYAHSNSSTVRLDVRAAFSRCQNRVSAVCCSRTYSHNDNQTDPRHTSL